MSPIYYKNGWWQGDDWHGVPRGCGTFHYDNGGKYVGRVEDGQPCGEGVLTYPDGTVYEGAFQYGGERTGNAKLTFPNGNYIKGHFEKGIIHDRYAEGKDSYGRWSGQYIRGERNGKFSYKCDGFTSEIVYSYDEIQKETVSKDEGEFIYLYSKGKIYYLKASYSNGNSYDGYADERGRRNGKGKLTYKNGDVLISYFSKGVANGSSEYHYYSISCVFRGYIKNGKFEGEGTYNYSGDELKGHFVSDYRKVEQLFEQANAPKKTNSTQKTNINKKTQNPTSQTKQSNISTKVQTVNNNNSIKEDQGYIKEQNYLELVELHKNLSTLDYFKLDRVLTLKEILNNYKDSDSKCKDLYLRLISMMYFNANINFEFKTNKTTINIGSYIEIEPNYEAIHYVSISEIALYEQKDKRCCVLKFRYFEKSSYHYTTININYDDVKKLFDLMSVLEEIKTKGNFSFEIKNEIFKNKQEFELFIRNCESAIKNSLEANYISKIKSDKINNYKEAVIAYNCLRSCNFKLPDLYFSVQKAFNLKKDLREKILKEFSSFKPFNLRTTKGQIVFSKSGDSTISIGCTDKHKNYIDCFTLTDFIYRFDETKGLFTLKIKSLEDEVQYNFDHNQYYVLVEFNKFMEKLIPLCSNDVKFDTKVFEDTIKSYKYFNVDLNIKPKFSTFLEFGHYNSMMKL